MGLADGVAWERDYGAPERRTVAGQQSDVSAIEAIEKAMEGVTPGPWEVKTADEWSAGFDFFAGQDEAFVFLADVEPVDAAYIAACNPVAMREVLALARQAEALQRENAELRAEIAKLRGMIRDNGTPRFNAVCDRAEAAEREVAELRAVMKDCHSALKMLVSRGVIQGTTVIGAFAAATSAERRARALLGGSENAGN